MTAFYIGQHEIDDEAGFADYLKQTMPFIEKHGGRYLTKAGTHEMLEGQRPESRRRCRISEQAGDQGLVQRSRLPPAGRQTACGGAQRHDRGGGPVKLYVCFGSKSRHLQRKTACPLLLQERRCAVQLEMSAKGQ